jgi:putative solute:sodium symporter small subunit
MRDLLDTYWRRNIQLKIIMLSIWGLASLGLAILAVEPLNEAEIGGFPLGFWMAQQGAIFTFVALIFVYAKIMDNRDRKLEADLEANQGGEA